MGYDAEKGFVSTNVDPSWLRFVDQLEKEGVDKATIEQNMAFAELRNAHHAADPERR